MWSHKPIDNIISDYTVIKLMRENIRDRKKTLFIQKNSEKLVFENFRWNDKNEKFYL